MKPKLVTVPDTGFLSLDAVLQVFPVDREHWHAGVRTGRYPAPVRIAPRVKAWRASEVRRFLAAMENGDVRPAVGRQRHVTFEQLTHQWLNKRKGELNAKSITDHLRRFEAHVFPYIGTLPPDIISPQNLIMLLQRVERASTPKIAFVVKGAISAVFRFAVVNGFASTNPAVTFQTSDVITTSQEQPHHAAFESTELPAFLAKLGSNDARLFPLTRLMVRMMLLTFVRNSELIHARWDEFNLRHKHWIIPAARMKAKRDHVVPLSRQTLRVLAELRTHQNGNGFVFPSVNDHGSSIHFNTIKGALTRLGYKGRMTSHGFRTLAMTTIKEQLHYRNEVIDRQLAHVERNVVRRAYDRGEYMVDRTRMMQEWADYLDGCERAGIGQGKYANNIRKIGPRSKRREPVASSKQYRR